MGRGPFSLEKGFLERKEAEYTQDALRDMAEYSDKYFREDLPEEKKRLASLQQDTDALVTNPVGRVLAGAGEEFNMGMAQLFTRLGDIASVIEKETGLKKGGAFDTLKKQFLDNAVYYNRMVQQRGVTEDIIMSILGGAIPGILNFTPGPLGIPLAATSGYAGAREAGESQGSSLLVGAKDAIHRAVLGKIFHSLAGKGGNLAERGFFDSLAPGAEAGAFAKNVATMGMIGGADTMISSGGKATRGEVAKGIVSMGVLGAMSGPKGSPEMTPAQKELSAVPWRLLKNEKGEDYRHFNVAEREANAELWGRLHMADPETYRPRTQYDTPEVILARVANMNMPQTWDIQTPERQQWREQTVRDMYGSGALKKDAQAFLIMGPPGSGKSSVLADKIRDKMGALVVDADLVKERAPEYGQGLYANRVHEESSRLAAHVFDLAVDNRENMVYPMIGKTIANVREIRDTLINNGYDVHLHYVHLDAHNAAQRTVQRFLNDGRFVDPVYVINAVDGNPRRSFEQLIQEGGLTSHAGWDANVERGQGFKPIAEWTSDSFRGLAPDGDTAGAAGGRIRGADLNRDAQGRGQAAGGGPGEEGHSVSRAAALGKNTNILHEDGQDVAKYALVDAAYIQSSHDPLRNFALNPKYPGNEIDAEGRNRMMAQERPYHTDRDAQEKVREISRSVRPELLITDNPDPINGPPILTPGMNVPGGNRRAMSLRLMYENNPDQAAIYKNYLVQNAERFGLDPAAVAAMERPVLTRMLLDPGIDADLGNFSRKVRFYNQSFTAGMPVMAEYVSKARLLSPDSMRILSDGLAGDVTLREYLAKSSAHDLFKSLVNDGVIEETKVSRYFSDKTGTLTQDGKSLVEGVLRGKIIEDYDVLAAAPPAALQRIDRAIPSLAKIKGHGGGWDLTPDLNAALVEYTKFKAASGIKTAGDYLAQDSLFGSSAEFMKNPVAVQLFRMLDEMTPTEFSSRIRQYARAAELAEKVKNQGSLGFFKPLDPASAFRKYLEADSVISMVASPAEQYRIAESLSESLSPKTILGDLSENIMNDLPRMDVEAGRARSLKNRDQETLPLPLNDLPLPLEGKGPPARGADAARMTRDQNDVIGKRAEEAAPGPGIVRTLGKQIDESLIETGVIEWSGKRIDNIHDLALAAQIYRDPRWETNRVFYAKKNEDGTFTIIHHAGLTQQLPDRCLAINTKVVAYKTAPEMINAGIKSIETNMEKYGATHVFFGHNHPSADAVRSSAADTIIHATLADRLGEKLAGVYITDGKNYYTATPDHAGTRRRRTGELPFNEISKYVPFKEEWGDIKTPDKFAKPAVPYPGIGAIIKSVAEMAHEGLKLSRDPDYAVLFVRSNIGKLTLIQEVHLDLLKDMKAATPFLQEAARKNGGGAYLYLPEGERSLSRGTIQAYLKDGIVEDIATTRPAGVGQRQGYSMRNYLGILEKPGYTLGQPATDWPIYQVRAEKVAMSREMMPDLSDPESQASKRFTAAAGEFLKRTTDELDILPELDLNWRRIETGESIAEAIKRTTALFENEMLAAKGYQSNKMTEMLAQDMGMNVEGLLRANGGKAFNATEITAMRWLHLSSAKQVMELAKQAARSTDEMDAFNFRRQLAIHYALQCQFYKYRAEAGRALQAWKITARENDAMVKEVSDFVAQMGGAGQAREMAAKIMGLETPDQISTFARQAHQATSLDMVLEAWINGLLSNPTTHAVNIAGNTSAMVWQIPERYLAAKISRFLDPQQEIFEGEATQMLYGMVQGFKDSLMLTARGRDAMRKAGEEAGRLDLVNAKETLGKALEESRLMEYPLFGQGETGADFGPAWKALISGDTSGQFGKMEMGKRAITGENVKANYPRLANALQQNGFDLGLAMDYLGEMVRGPGRLLMTEDEVFKAGGYRMELHAQAFRMASKEGLTGEAFGRRVQEIIADPPKDIKAAAVDSSTYLTFTQKLNESENALKKFSGEIVRAANAHPSIRFIMPFIRTPVNILAFTAERTPLGLFIKSIRNDIFSGGGPERALAIARMSLGSMVMAVAYELTMSDMITGGGPGDKELREAKLRTGWQPYSLKVGDQYVAYNRLDPFGSIVGMAADAAEAWNHLQEDGSEDSREKLAVMVVASLAKNLTNKTYLEGLSRFIDAIHNPDRYGSGWIDRFLASFAPSGLAHVERLIDPTVRETQGFIDAIRAKIPGLSQDLPAKRNIWGDPIVLEGALGPDIVSPFYTSRDKRSPIDDEIVRNRIDHIQTPTARQVFQGVELTAKQHSRFLEIMGKEVKTGGRNLKDLMNEVITAPEYQELSDGPMGGKALALSRIFHQYREQAKHFLLNEDLDVREKVLGIKRKKIEARTGRPAPGMPTLQ